MAWLERSESPGGSARGVPVTSTALEQVGPPERGGPGVAEGHVRVRQSAEQGPPAGHPHHREGPRTDRERPTEAQTHPRIDHRLARASHVPTLGGLLRAHATHRDPDRVDADRGSGDVRGLRHDDDRGCPGHPGLGGHPAGRAGRDRIQRGHAGRRPVRHHPPVGPERPHGRIDLDGEPGGQARQQQRHREHEGRPGDGDEELPLPEQQVTDRDAEHVRLSDDPIGAGPSVPLGQSMHTPAVGAVRWVCDPVRLQPVKMHPARDTGVRITRRTRRPYYRGTPMAVADGNAPSSVDAPASTPRGRATPSRTRPPGGGRTATAVVASYLALSVAIYWQPWSTGITSRLQPGGDQYAGVWYLRWTAFAIVHGHDPFFTTWANHPAGVNLLTNTSVPLLGLIGTPITVLFGPIATFNVLSTVALAASATAAYVFARRWTTWRPAAWVCGLVYGFSPYEIAQANGHLNLTFVALPPLILLAVHEVAVRQQWSSRRAGATLGLLLTAQFFISSELLASSVLLSLVCLAAAAVVGRRRVRDHARRALVGAAWAAGVAGVLLSYPVWFALRGPGHISGPIQLVPEAYRADLLGILVPGPYIWLAPAWALHTSSVFANSRVENGSYLGISLVVTVVVAVILLWRREPVIRVAAVALGTAFVVSLGGALALDTRPGAALTGLPLPERAFAHLPLLSNTVPVRYTVYVSLFAGLILAVAVDRLHRALAGRGPRRGRRSRRGSAAVAAIPALLAALCLIPLIPVIPLQGFGDPRVPAYFTAAELDRIDPGSVALLYPFPSTPTPDGQLWQAVAGMRFQMPGGYFLVPHGPDHKIAFDPATGYVTDSVTTRALLSLAAGFPPSETPALRAAMLAQLRVWGVTTLLAAPVADVRRPARSVQFLTWLVGVPPEPGAGVLAWYHLPV